ncbi:hypothetical protein [Flavobacterium defluvii]|uniref:Uncharacterized protein n=1 Tax=Flavobacterium defluvii TaxID=370979 RepID=A0A1M5IYF0_9FLAO|nr:hypothetical protein [Flavobacterium defluvii]SHG33155.1 hypothetical protein SAMN05443663_102546 [Flavobacterium defluvii]
MEYENYYYLHNYAAQCNIAPQTSTNAGISGTIYNDNVEISETFEPDFFEEGFSEMYFAKKQNNPDW